MRFRFCGDLDCPDWVLAEISTLAKIYEKILKLTSDARFESSDIKATIAVLCFILSSAAKHNVSSDNLSSELQQLGLPKEHAVSLCRSYEEKQTALQETLRESSLRLSHLSSVSWRVDQTLSSSILQEVDEPLVHLNLHVADARNSSPVAVTVSSSKLRVLLTELKQALEMMNAIN
ncbi:COMM domain-containing protein 4 isoform X2 [Rana temporaria]|uniref:COMM domain-containing protein 4 isoform X2 n=1 Tax=Rana temporaria TaxID=8407 RepID=UPI001AADAE97|nr:COMM domain-containing protein 4 isoform X2 [Rana temporaria]